MDDGEEVVADTEVAVEVGVVVDAGDSNPPSPNIERNIDSQDPPMRSSSST